MSEVILWLGNARKEKNTRSPYILHLFIVCSDCLAARMKAEKGTNLNSEQKKTVSTLNTKKKLLASVSLKGCTKRRKNPENKRKTEANTF